MQSIYFYYNFRANSHDAMVIIEFHFIRKARFVIFFVWKIEFVLYKLCNIYSLTTESFENLHIYPLISLELKLAIGFFL